MASNAEHHFVPQFYLRRFAAPSRPAAITTYLIDRRQMILNAPISGQAKRRKLYGTLEKEKALGVIESASAAAIAETVREKRVPKRGTPQHDALLAHLIFQHYRTPQAADDANLSSASLIEEIGKTDVSLASELTKHKIPTETAVAMALDISVKGLLLISDMWIKLLQHTGSSHLIASDNPVILYNQLIERGRPWQSGTGIASAGLQMLLPLDSKHCLVAYDESVYSFGGRNLQSTLVDIDSSEVSKLNLLQAMNADAQLFLPPEISQAAVEDLLDRAAGFRAQPRTKVESFVRKDKPSSFLYTTRKNDLRISLSFRNARVLPKSSELLHSSETVLFRNKPLFDAWEKRFGRDVPPPNLPEGTVFVKERRVAGPTP